MNKCASEADVLASPSAVNMELRHAQRAFAAFVDQRSRAGEFRSAQLRAMVGRTLSALSADDRAALSDWLSLQLATGTERDAEGLLGVLARIDARVAVRVRRELPHRIEALARQSGAERIVAA